jgi:hypothetical protein
MDHRAYDGISSERDIVSIDDDAGVASVLVRRRPLEPTGESPSTSMPEMW